MIISQNNNLTHYEDNFVNSKFFLFITISFGQEVKHYDLKVKFNVPKRIFDVKGTVNLDLNNKDSIIFVLWKDTDIKKITSD